MTYLRLFVIAMFSITPAAASSIDDIVLSQLSFDIQTETADNDDVGTYTGQAGLMGSEIGFSVAAFPPLTDTTSTLGFNLPSPINTVAYEHVHVGNFVITFDAPVANILLFAQNDNFDSLGIDLGTAPKQFAGTTTQTGTQFSVNSANQGSFFLYEFLVPTNTVENVSGGPGIGGGFNLAFFPNVLPAPIPLPASAWLLISAFGGFSAVRRFFPKRTIT
ncbi:MAG: VPLPA-CTERM sorting domain-containing protein [Pseudomonadota bacterium]